jgi:hypothetical protein
MTQALPTVPGQERGVQPGASWQAVATKLGSERALDSLSLQRGQHAARYRLLIDFTRDRSGDSVE